MPTTRGFPRYRSVSATQSETHFSVVWLLYHFVLPSSWLQHQRDVVVWLFRITANPSAVSAATTASNTWSGVFPRSCGFAVTAASGTGAVMPSISFEKGRRTLLIPSEWKSLSSVGNATRSSPIGMS
jgi:hypothetical protein